MIVIPCCYHDLCLLAHWACHLFLSWSALRISFQQMDNWRDQISVLWWNWCEQAKNWLILRFMCSEHNGTTMLAKFETLMEWDHFVAHCNSICKNRWWSLCLQHGWTSRRLVNCKINFRPAHLLNEFGYSMWLNATYIQFWLQFASDSLSRDDLTPDLATYNWMLFQFLDQTYYVSHKLWIDSHNGH